MEDWLGITRIETDAYGNATKITGPNGDEVSYTYTATGQRESITYPDSTKVEYEYDQYTRLTSLIQGGKVIRYGYDEFGQLNKKIYPNGMETSYKYTIKGQVEEMVHRDAEGILDQYKYGYDILGNKTSLEKYRRELKEESGKYIYGYDAVGRLASVEKDGTALKNYTYDAFGNRISLTENGSVTNYSYNALNQLVLKNDIQGETTYRYDKRGNLTKVLENGMIENEYIYGAINKLEKALNSNGEIAEYIYNGLGHRVGREQGEMVTLSREVLENSLDPIKSLEMYEINPTSKIDYILDLTRGYNNLLQKRGESGTQSYFWDGKVAGMLDAETEGYYLNDEMGSVIRFADDAGNIKQSYGYDEFGQDLYFNQGSIQPFGYTGYQYDSVADTYYAQAREYRSVDSRFCARDLVAGATNMPITLNRYTYCFNNAMALVDLNGAWPSISDIGNGLKNIGTGVVNKVTQLGNEAWEAAKSFGEDVYTSAVDFGNSVKKTAGEIASSIGETYNEFKTYVGKQLNKAGTAITNGARKFGNMVASGWNEIKSVAINGWNCAKGIAIDAWNSAVDFVFEEIVGVDTVYYSDDDGFGTTSEIVSHTGGNVFVLQKDIAENTTGWSINASITLFGTTFESSLTGESWNPSTWEFNQTISRPMNDNVEIEMGTYMDGDGVGMQYGFTGNVDTLPFELPDGVVIKDFEDVTWSVNTKVQFMNWKECFECVLVLGAVIGVVYIVANDFTGVGVVDDAALVPLGSYIATKAPWLYDMISQLFPKLQSCFN